LNWLREFVPVAATAEQLADRLTMAGVAVEAVLRPGAGIRKVVTGRLLAVERHPDADRLFVCRVDAGTEELTIVTGATNVATGQIVPVALHGSVLAGGKTIKQSRLRGVMSQGMLCSGQELGLETKLLSPEEQHGILILPPGTPVGQSVIELMGMDDAVLVLDLTPNRGDCLSVYGVAREVAALYGLPLAEPDISLPPARGGTDLEVDIADPVLCRRYVARPIDGVAPGPSPLWLAGRLRLAGVRPIGNIVDVTNYVMLELGQPLHAFDARRIAGGRITVRRARSGEGMTTLDGVERPLTEDMLLIADQEGPVAVAGVMGGLDSEITDRTTGVVLESAAFDPVSVRRTSRNLGLRSEASLRFEKGMDPAGCLRAADRAAKLILALAGGALLDPVDAYPAPVRKRAITIRAGRINELLGVEVPPEKGRGFLTALGCEVHEDDGRWVVDVPTWRADLTAECDLVEEVGRLYGYMNLPETMPIGPSVQGGVAPAERTRRLVARTVAACGLREVVTMSLVAPAALAPFAAEEKALRLLNPLSEEQSVLRTSLLPGLVGVLVRNFHRQVRDMAVFELGRVFLPRPEEKLPAEGERLAAAVMGSPPPHWRGPRAAYDFYYLKGVLEAVFRALGLAEPEWVPASLPGFHPGRTAAVRVGDEEVGRLGELHPALLRELGLGGVVAALELDLGRLPAVGVVSFRPLPRHPAVERDLAVVVRRDVPAGAVLETARRAGGATLREVSLFDVYEGGNLPPDSRSLACRLVFRADDRTLTDDEVNRAVDGIVAGLAAGFGARLRG